MEQAARPSAARGPHVDHDVDGATRFGQAHEADGQREDALRADAGSRRADAEPSAAEARHGVAMRRHRLREAERVGP